MAKSCAHALLTVANDIDDFDVVSCLCLSLAHGYQSGAHCVATQMRESLHTNAFLSTYHVKSFAHSRQMHETKSILSTSLVRGVSTVGEGITKVLPLHRNSGLFTIYLLHTLRRFLCTRNLSYIDRGIISLTLLNGKRLRQLSVLFLFQHSNCKESTRTQNQNSRASNRE